MAEKSRFVSDCKVFGTVPEGNYTNLKKKKIFPESRTIHRADFETDLITNLTSLRALQVSTRKLLRTFGGLKCIHKEVVSFVVFVLVSFLCFNRESVCVHVMRMLI